MLIRTGNNIIRLSKAGGRVKSAQEEIDRLRAEKQEIERKLTESRTEDYVERIAREKLGLGKPGEVVVVLDDSKIPNQSFDSAQDGQPPNWKLWRKLYLGF